MFHRYTKIQDFKRCKHYSQETAWDKRGGARGGGDTGGPGDVGKAAEIGLVASGGGVVARCGLHCRRRLPFQPLRLPHSAQVPASSREPAGTSADRGKVRQHAGGGKAKWSVQLKDLPAKLPTLLLQTTSIYSVLYAVLFI